MKQSAVQNKRYYHGDFRSATIAPEVDTRARNYDLFVQHKTPVGLWQVARHGRQIVDVMIEVEWKPFDAISAL